MVLRGLYEALHQTQLMEMENLKPHFVLAFFINEARA